MNCYTAAGIEVLGLAVPLVLVGAYDVWVHVWKTQKNVPTVHRGESPGNHPTRSPRSPR